MTLGPKAYVARHLHVVRDVPTEFRTDWADMLSNGTAAPAQIAGIARSRGISSPTPHDGWVIVVGEILGNSLYWMWGPRLRVVDADPFGPEYTGPMEALKPIRLDR